MAIFISYSHKDEAFVNKLAATLVKHKARVWVDKWELKVGDSLIQRIQEAIREASALIVVISKASVESEWCKKELSAGLVRELGEKRVVVFPVLADDCEIPLFLQDKMYADFRQDFEEGLRLTLEAIASVTSDTLGRIEQPESNIDFGLDWNLDSGLYHLRVTLLEHAEKEPHSVITEVYIHANQTATERYLKWEKRELAWYARLVIMQMAASIEPRTERYLLLEDSLPKVADYGVGDTERGIEYKIHVESRRIGEDNGKDIFIDWGSQLDTVLAGFEDAFSEAPREIKLQVAEGIREITLSDGELPL